MGDDSRLLHNMVFFPHEENSATVGVVKVIPGFKLVLKKSCWVIHISSPAL